MAGTKRIAFKQLNEFVVDGDDIWCNFSKPPGIAKEEVVLYNYDIRQRKETELEEILQEDLSDIDSENEVSHRGGGRKNKGDSHRKNSGVDAQHDDGDDDSYNEINNGHDSEIDRGGIGCTDTDAYQVLNHEQLWENLGIWQKDTSADAGLLIAIEFGSCAKKSVERLVNILAPDVLDAERPRVFPRFLDILEQSPTRRGQMFFTGKQLRGVKFPNRESACLLFVSLPVLSLAEPESGISVPKYFMPSAQGSSLPMDDKHVVVNKAWFMAIGNEVVAIFQDAKWRQPACLPNQFRMGAIHFLVQAISSVLKASDSDIAWRIEQHCRKLHEEIYDTIHGTSLHIAESGGQGGVDLTHAAQSTIAVLGKTQRTIQHIAGIASILTEQAKILDGLAILLESGLSDRDDTDYGGNITIPRISGFIRQIPHAILVIRSEARRRTNLAEALKVDLPSLRSSCTQLLVNARGPVEAYATHRETMTTVMKEATEYRNSSEREQGNRNLELLREIKETLRKTHEKDQPLERLVQLLNANRLQFEAARTKSGASEASMASLMGELVNLGKDNQEELQSQSELYSFFTVVTAVFLPLGFFTQYFALPLNNGKLPTQSHREFWGYSGPFVILFSVFVFILVVFKNEYSLNEMIKALTDCLIYILTFRHRGWWRMPQTRREVLDEKSNREKREREDKVLLKIKQQQRESREREIKERMEKDIQKQRACAKRLLEQESAKSDKRDLEKRQKERKMEGQEREQERPLIEVLAQDLARSPNLRGMSAFLRRRHRNQHSMRWTSEELV